MSVAVISLYLHTMLGVRRARGLLDEGAQQLRLELRDVQALLDGVGRQHHVVVDPGRVHHHRREQQQRLQVKNVTVTLY